MHFKIYLHSTIKCSSVSNKKSKEIESTQSEQKVFFGSPIKRPKINHYTSTILNLLLIAIDFFFILNTLKISDYLKLSQMFLFSNAIIENLFL